MKFMKADSVGLESVLIYNYQFLQPVSFPAKQYRPSPTPIPPGPQLVFTLGCNMESREGRDISEENYKKRRRSVSASSGQQQILEDYKYKVTGRESSTKKYHFFPRPLDGRGAGRDQDS